LVHAFPQLPQFLRSVLRSLQVPLQDVRPLGHVHDPSLHDVPPVHTVLQLPQFQLSFCVLTQLPWQ
jgi:hypothetical protein